MFAPKDLPSEVKEAQERKLEELKKQQELHDHLAVERKLFLRDKKIKFFGDFLFHMFLLHHIIRQYNLVVYKS